MSINDNIKLIYNQIEILFLDENTGHDMGHLKRVYEYAKEIQSKEGGDEYVILISALVHDLHRLMANKTSEYVYPKDSLGVVKNILIDCKVDKNKVEQILNVVKYHENKNLQGLPLEIQIVQDADILDAIGEIGLERTIKYSKANNIPITNHSFPLDCKEYIPDINPISTCHYIYRTMIPNYNNLHTKTAKNLAVGKIELLKNFVKENY